MNHQIHFWVPRFAGDEKSLLAEVVDSGFLNDGPRTTEFENKIARLLGCKHVVATTSGTAAIYLALAAIDIGPGDEVIVPDVTFIATANAVSLTGAKPVLADVDPQTMNLDPERAERAITSRTKAIVPVHISGRAADLDGLQQVAQKHGLAIVEDAAEALLSKHQGKFLGTFGVAGCFSLSPNKTITTGQGGLIATDDDLLHVRLRELKDQGRPVRGTGGDDVHSSVGYNFKFTDLQAAVGLAQLKELPERAARMTAMQRCYAAQLQNIEGFKLLPFDVDAGELPQWSDALVEDRDRLFDALAAQGIRGRRFWHPLHTQTPYRQSPDAFPVSSAQVPKAMWLPSAFTLSDQDIATVCNEIRKNL